MKEFYNQLVKAKLTIADVRNYERQMPENRLKIHQIISYLVNEKQVPILYLANEVGVDRGKIYRMLNGLDVDCLPARWSKEEEDILKRLYVEKTPQQIADYIGRSKSSIVNRARILKLKKPRGKSVKFSTENYSINELLLLRYKFTFGKYAGRKMRQIQKIDPDYILQVSQMDDIGDIPRKAAQYFLNKHLPACLVCLFALAILQS